MHALVFSSTQFYFIAQVLITHFRNCFEVCSGLRSTSTHLLIYREWRCNASRWNDSRSNAWSRIALKRPALNGDPTGLAFGGTGLCSYRVRGVDGSCAERLTVESYTAFICQQSYLLLFGIPSPTHSFIPGLKPSFLQILPTAALPFSSAGFTTWIPQTVYCFLSISVFYFYFFSVFTLFSCRFRAVDQADSCWLSSAR